MKIPANLHDQIRSAWARIDRRVNFRLVHDGQHPKVQAFEDFLESVVSLHSEMRWETSIEKDAMLHFEIHVDGEDMGIHFQGLPLGHELTSFVLAPLVAAGQAKMPDEHTQRRIKALKGPFDVVSYVSLTCENCPTVVQALNQIAAINPNLRHTMVEGSLFPELVEQQGILSVPTVTVNGETFSTGRQEMSGLLDKLEEQFQVEDDEPSATEIIHKKVDVVVVGGGPAGISAAIYTARKGLKTMVVSENIGGLVKETKGIENLISTKYIEGPELAQSLRDHMEAYPIEVMENQRVSSVEVVNGMKHLSLRGGVSVEAPALIAATGARWRELDVAGEKEYLGRGVAFCPHCDGPFYKNKDIVVVGGGNSGVEAALDLAGICRKVTLLERGERVKADKVLADKLFARSNVEVITMAETVEIVGDGQKVKALKYRNKQNQEVHELALSGVFIQIGLVPNSSWIASQVETTAHGEVSINERCETNVEGIYAAGDVSTVPYKQIVVAMGEGAKAGLKAAEHLMSLS